MTEEELKHEAWMSTFERGWVPLPIGAAPLCFQWRNTPLSFDGQLCGIFADWLEDHREECLAKAPAEAVDWLIAKFRRHFADPTRNMSQG